MTIPAVDVTIRMPEDWVNRFWGWWLDGGGDDGFLEDIDSANCQDEVVWGDEDRNRLLLVYAKNDEAAKIAMPPPVQETSNGPK